MTESRTSARIALVMSALAVIWYGFLILVAALTANPTQLNARQILSSRWVLIATVNLKGDVVVLKSVVGVLPDGPIRLTDACRYPEREIILPLVREFGDFRITPTQLPQADRLTYLSNETSTKQLSEILKRQED